MLERGRLNILLVEDNAADARLIMQALGVGSAPLDARIERADRLEGALDRVGRERFDVVLLDLGLPDCRGIKTFVTFVEHAPKVPVVVLTGLDDAEVGLRAVHDGAQDYVVKQDLQGRTLTSAVRYAVERHRLVLALEQSRDSLRLLARHLQEVREQERTRISRDIHDSFGQKLTALKMDLRWLDRRVDEPASESLRATLHDRIDGAELLVDEAFEIVKRIAIDLRPSVLDHLGLWDAVRDESRRFESRTGVRTVLDLPGNSVVIEEKLATTCFRIIQELLTNVGRHAHASQVDIKLSYAEGDVRLHFEDDGVGLPAEPAPASSLGLLGVEERVREFDGEVVFDTAPGKGARIRMRIPMTMH